jgi:hypothetical protein
MGNYQQAVDRLNMSAQIWKANSNTIELANCLTQIALTQQRSGEHDAAESSYLEAAKMLVDDNKGQGLEVRMTTEENYASLLEEMGRLPVVNRPSVRCSTNPAAASRPVHSERS